MLKNSNVRSSDGRVYASEMVLFLANLEQRVQSGLSRLAEWWKYNPLSFIAGYQNRASSVPSCALQPQHSSHSQRVGLCLVSVGTVHGLSICQG